MNSPITAKFSTVDDADVFKDAKLGLTPSARVAIAKRRNLNHLLTLNADPDSLNQSTDSGH